MPVLTLSHESEILNTYFIQERADLKIGRNDQNDIVLDESAVSGFHAEIEFDADGFYLTDIQSKNGTFVNGELVISRKLQHGNIISIGSYTLVFEYKDNENRYDDTAAPISEATMMLDTSTHRAKLAKSLSELDDYKKKTKSQGILSFLDDAREPMLINKPIITIGKDAGCDIVVKGLLVAKIAGEIVQRNDGFYLKPTGAKISPKLNYKSIKSEVKLNDFDVIEIGSTKLQFHLSIT